MNNVSYYCGYLNCFQIGETNESPQLFLYFLFLKSQ